MIKINFFSTLNYTKMQGTKNLIKQIDETYTEQGKQLIIDFFMTFSRLEYALKSAGFLIEKKNSVSPDWSKFAKSIEKNFDKDYSQSVRNSVNYILENPPKIQVVSFDILAWQDRTIQENEPIIQRLKSHICDIRNNLFHGGKFDGDFEPEISRNYLLLEHSLIILNYWLTLSTFVNHNFPLPNL